MTQIEKLEKLLPELLISTDPRTLKVKSRDYFWFSPILKPKLNKLVADAVVVPANEEQVKQTLAACFELNIPVTPRGGGTGNYGQAMPLEGGIVLDLSQLNSVLEVKNGWFRAHSGILLVDINDAAKPHGLELRQHPSTLEHATIGGFVAGGSGGLGSLRWGMLYEPGNILGLRIVTMEKEPQVLDLAGEKAGLVHHAYGVNGVITEVKMALGPTQDWVEVCASFKSWEACLRAGEKLAGAQGLWLKEVAAIEAPAPTDYFTRHRKFYDVDDHLLCILSAPSSIEPLVSELSASAGKTVYRSDQASEEEKEGLPPLHHLVWNHTTMQAIKEDRSITYLQVAFMADDQIAQALEVADRFPKEVIGHVEFTRRGGRVNASFLPLIKVASNDRLREVIQELADMGCPDYSPHHYTLEEGGRADALTDQLALKNLYDPKGLLNPGKIIAWEQPDYRYNPNEDYVYSRSREAVS